jgi:hypothetical protein
MHFLYTFLSLFHPFHMKMSEDSVTSGNGEDPRGRNPWKEVGYMFFESVARRVVAAQSATRQLRTVHSAGRQLE